MNRRQEINEEQGKVGMVLNIQRYSIHDGPGIRTTVFLKGCPLRCFWCQNPESQIRKQEIFLNRENCTACGRCVMVCPAKANSIEEGRVLINRKECMGCGECVRVCPNKARTLMGKTMAVSEVLREVMRDKKFYENSGGGVTLSGGEPTAQPQFALALLKSFKLKGLHAALDTCGYAPWDVIEGLLEFVDLVLYDIKCMDAVKHEKATGKSNEVILENAIRVARLKPTRIRVPIVPSWNDSKEEIKAIASFVRNELGNGIPIDLLPYNKMGESKYERLDRVPIRKQLMEEQKMEELRRVVASVRCP